MKNNTQQPGFTLIEMLISLTIFMIFIGIIAGSYASLVSANRTANEAQKTYREIRFVFDTFANAIRSGALDYSCIDQSKLDVLCLENQNPEKKVLSVLHADGASRSLFKFDGKKILVLKQTRARLDEPWGATVTWQPMTTEKLSLEDLSFTFFPLKNPYDAENAAFDEVQWQPSVTISLRAKGRAFRTTYSSRTYGRQTLYTSL